MFLIHETTFGENTLKDCLFFDIAMSLCLR